MIQKSSSSSYTLGFQECENKVYYKFSKKIGIKKHPKIKQNISGIFSQKQTNLLQKVNNVCTGPQKEYIETVGSDIQKSQNEIEQWFMYKRHQINLYVNTIKNDKVQQEILTRKLTDNQYSAIASLTMQRHNTIRLQIAGKLALEQAKYIHKQCTNNQQSLKSENFSPNILTQTHSQSSSNFDQNSQAEAAECTKENSSQQCNEQIMQSYYAKQAELSKNSCHFNNCNHLQFVQTLFSRKSSQSSEKDVVKHEFIQQQSYTLPQDIKIELKFEQ